MMQNIWNTWPLSRSKNLHNASLLTFCMYTPSIIHAALKTLVASCLVCLCFVLEFVCGFACVGVTRSIGGCVCVCLCVCLGWLLWYDWFFSGLISLQIYHAWRMRGEKERHWKEDEERGRDFSIQYEMQIQCRREANKGRGLALHVVQKESASP